MSISKGNKTKLFISTSKVLFHNRLHGISMILKEVQKQTNVVTLQDAYDFVFNVSVCVNSSQSHEYNVHINVHK